MPLFKRLGCSELFINSNATETVSNFRQKDPIHHGIQREKKARWEEAEEGENLDAESNLHRTSGSFLFRNLTAKCKISRNKDQRIPTSFFPPVLTVQKKPLKLTMEQLPF